MSSIDSDLDAALRSVFYPLANLMVRDGIAVRPVIQVLKEAFVAAAVNVHGRDDRPASTSKAADIIGLTRKEVGDIRKRPDRSDSMFAAIRANTMVSLPLR